MGYAINIGERTGKKGRGRDVAHVELPDAPRFDGDERTGRSNSRHPSYSQWPEFARAVGLDLFFFHAERGTMRDHPGIVPLEPRHLRTVRKALAEYKASNPDSVPGWGKRQDPMLARMLWLEFWISWALKNCKFPARENH